MWVAAPAAFLLGSAWQDRLMLWPALSGAAIFLNRFAESTPTTASYYEEPIGEEKSQCAAEMKESVRPGLVRFTPVRYE
jgi:hypothetical protein